MSGGNRVLNKHHVSYLIYVKVNERRFGNVLSIMLNREKKTAFFIDVVSSPSSKSVKDTICEVE
jgi:hypothetical protein